MEREFNSVIVKNSNSAYSDEKVKYFLSLSLLALFFAFSFFQDVILNSVSQNLIHDYHFTSFEVSVFSCVFFLSSGIFFIFSGLWLKKSTIKNPVLFSATLVLVSTLIFLFSKTFIILVVGRALIGLGYSFAFVCCMQFAAVVYGKRFALMVGLISALLILFGMLAQGPFVYLVDYAGLHFALLMNSFLGFMILFGLYLLRQSYNLTENKNESEASFFSFGVLSYLKNRNLYLLSGYASLINTPILFLGSLWGNIYLVTSFKLSRETSGFLLSLLFLGLLIGCSTLGWLGEQIKNRRKIMLISPCVMVFMSIVLFTKPLSMYFLGIDLFFLGFLAAAQTLVYPQILDSISLDQFSSMVGVTTFFIMIANATLQSLFGFLLFLHINPMILLPICLLVVALKQIYTG